MPSFDLQATLPQYFLLKVRRPHFCPAAGADSAGRSASQTTRQTRLLRC